MRNCVFHFKSLMHKKKDSTFIKKQIHCNLITIARLITKIKIG